MIHSYNKNYTLIRDNRKIIIEVDSKFYLYPIIYLTYPQICWNHPQNIHYFLDIVPNDIKLKADLFVKEIQ